MISSLPKVRSSIWTKIINIMYELSNQIRLIVVPEFNIENTDMFIGFIAGILSQDHDLDKIYLDSFLTTACIDAIWTMPLAN